MAQKHKKDKKNINKVIKKDFKGKLRVNRIEEQLDGSAKVIFDSDDDFIEWFKEWQGLKRWSRKRFEAVLVEALENLIKKEKK
jgi:hypothetical protein